MGFNTRECAWHQTSVTILGRTLVGIRGFDFEKDVEKEYLYGAGSDPIDIQSGNKSYPCSLRLLKYEVDLLNDAALAAGFEDIVEVPHEAIVITCVFKKTLTSPIRTITAAAVAFKNIKASLEQNGKMTEVTLPGLSMKTVFK